ncbi:MerR family transcriptional regulator [Paenibacillus hunanensis]|uniref:MerR family transcriptional regulator n=1 Tax=Paenibacillus hunanensis TaxID=539262 RepID=UPI002027205A|nr:MerR family transcriptional regulator [Paenibacillus hunanensis]MCL9659510.1 MerR family transcriptional regulator [Paenibacillus hunanensis]
MENILSIQEMTVITGLSAHTLRYYERIGLLRDVKRNDQGYRVYHKQDVSWVQFLLRLRDTGMPIAGMQRFSELRSQGDMTASARREMLEQHHAQLEQQLQLLQSHIHNIGDKIEYYRELEKKTPLL